MFYRQALACGILVAGIVLGAPQLAFSSDESAVDRLYREFGIRFSDAHPCTMEMPASRGTCKSFVLSEVREDSEAYLAGLRPGHVSTLFRPHVQNSNKSLESYSKDVLGDLPRKRFEAEYRCEFDDLLTAFQNGGSYEETFCSYDRKFVPFMLGRVAAEAHLGLKMDDRGTVVQIIEPSPASVAGIQVGDRLVHAIGPQDDLDTNLMHLREALYAVLYGQTQYLYRDGETVRVDMPSVAFGEVVDPALAQAELTENEARIFEELPEIIRPFLTAIYGGRFARAEFEKDVFYGKVYTTTLAAQLGENSIGQEASARMDRLVAAARFGPLVAQYGLVKLNTVGNCGRPVTTIPYTETVIQTISNGYGVELSRSVISQADRSFDIDTRFAPYVVEADQVSPRPAWSVSLSYFISRAGGCESAILEQFEENLLAYQSY